MALAVNWNRTKLNVTLAQADNATLANPVEGTLKWFVALRLDNITLDQQTEPDCSAGSGVAIITKDSGTFGDVRKGDLITGDANIPAGSYVVTKDSDTQITIDQVTTGAVSGATLTVNATGTKQNNMTILGLELAYTPGTNVVTVNPTFHTYDGTQTEDAGNTGTDEADETNSQGTITLATQTSATFQINLDDFLGNARVARTDT